MQHRFQHREHVPLADRLHAAHILPLGHGIYGIDVEDARLAVLLSLMYGIDAQVTRPAQGIGLASLADVDLPALGGPHLDALAPVGWAVAQIVEMGHGDARQPFVLPLAEYAELAQQKTPQRRPGQIFMRGIGGG
jgi:hypothetical protein